MEYKNRNTGHYEPATGKDGSVDTTIKESQVMVGVDVQSRYQSTIQTHVAVSVAATGYSTSSWVDCSGFDKISVSMLNDAGTTSRVHLQYSNDGTNIHGVINDVLGNNAVQIKEPRTVDVQARYARVQLYNGDAVAHTMSAWAMLKS